MCEYICMCVRTALDTESEVEQKIREERDIVNSLNEVFVENNMKKISNLNHNLRDALVLLNFVHLLEPNIINWQESIIVEPKNNRFQCLTNCHYLVSVLKALPFAFQYVFTGDDVYYGNHPIICEICRHLLNYYSLKVLSRLMISYDGSGGGSELTEYDILHWCNEHLKKMKVPRFCAYEERYINSWTDPSLKSSLYYLDLLLMIDKESIERESVVHSRNRSCLQDYTKHECLRFVFYF